MVLSALVDVRSIYVCCNLKTLLLALCVCDRSVFDVVERAYYYMSWLVLFETQHARLIFSVFFSLKSLSSFTLHRK